MSIFIIAYIEHFPCPENPVFVFISLLSTPLSTTDIFIVSVVLPFSDCLVAGTVHHAAFSDWLPSLSHAYLRLLQSLHGWIAHVLLSLNNIPLPGGTRVIYPFTSEGLLGCF